MGRLLNAAIDRAGLSDIADRALRGDRLGDADLAVLRASDVLVVAGLADAVRARHRGDDVRLFGADGVRRAADVVAVDLATAGSEGVTGQELLFQVAIARLAAPADKSVAISYEQVGIELAQAALAFGADALIGDLTTQAYAALARQPGRAPRRDHRLDRACRPQRAVLR